MALLTAAIKSSGGVNSPQKYRSGKEKKRLEQLQQPIATLKEEVRIKNLVYEPTYLILIGGIPVAEYTPDFEYDEEIDLVEEIEEQWSPDQFCLDSFERIVRISSRVAEDVKGKIIELSSIFKMQMLVALADIDEGRIVQTGPQGSEISYRFTKKQSLIDPNSTTSLTQAANSSESEIEKISAVKEILSKLPPSSRSTARLEDPEFAAVEELWLNALQKAKRNGEILNFWVRPQIYPDLGDVRIFRKPYVPFCIYETKRGELVLVDVRDVITRDDWLEINVFRALLKDVIKIFKTYVKTILIEEWSRDLAGIEGVKPRKPPRVDPYRDLCRVSFWDLVT